jgi:uncharacterized protein (TIRG00374 family)
VTDRTAAEQPAANGGDAAESDPLKRRFLNRRTLLSFLLGIIILAVVFSRVNVEVGAILAQLASANPLYYAAALLVYYATFPLRGLRWRKLLENVGFHENHGVRLPLLRELSQIIMLSWFANCIVPAKLGDAYRAYLLKQDAGVSFSKTFGTILAERMIDMLLLFVLLVGSVLLAFRGALPEVILSLIQIGLVLAALVVVGLFAMRKFSARIVQLVPHRFKRQYGLFEQGTLGSFRALPFVLGLSVVSWGIEATRLYLVCLSLGLSSLSPAIILFVALAAALLTTLPVTPAGLGFVESAIVGILILAASFGLAPGVNENLATSVAILDRTISYWSVIVVGFVLYALRSRRAGVAAQPARP